jgi:hypothetical protein
MMPWIQVLGVGLLAVSGHWLGRWFSKLRKPWWAIGYLLPLLVVCLYGLSNRLPQLALTPPFSWIPLGQRRYVLVGFVATLMFSTLLSRMPRRRERIAIGVLIVVVVSMFSMWPFLWPVFNRAELLRLKTRMDADGICLQNSDYTCGAAAAVTGLRKLGLPAEEGEIAILAHTSLIGGTDPAVLAEELQKRYGADDLVAEYRFFKNLEELRAAGLTLVVVKFSLTEDHFITVFEVTDDSVIIGDPLTGRADLPRQAFLDKWRRVGVVLRRQR